MFLSGKPKRWILIQSGGNVSGHSGEDENERVEIQPEWNIECAMVARKKKEMGVEKKQQVSDTRSGCTV